MTDDDFHFIEMEVVFVKLKSSIAQRRGKKSSVNNLRLIPMHAKFFMLTGKSRCVESRLEREGCTLSRVCRDIAVGSIIFLKKNYDIQVLTMSRYIFFILK